MNSGKRILIVEMDPVVNGWLCQLLRASAFQVSVAGSLREALMRLSSSGDFAAVICDSSLPDVTCPELLAGLRSIQNTHVPVLLTSANWFHSALPELGVELLAKPFDAAQLLAALERLLRLSRLPEMAARNSAHQYRH